MPAKGNGVVSGVRVGEGGHRGVDGMMLSLNMQQLFLISGNPGIRP